MMVKENKGAEALKMRCVYTSFLSPTPMVVAENVKMIGILPVFTPGYLLLNKRIKENSRQDNDGAKPKTGL
jgi:hypothetical protein